MQVTRVLVTPCMAAVVGIVSSISVPTSPALAEQPPSVEQMIPTNIRVAPLPGAVLVEWDPVTVIGKNDLGFGYSAASVATGYFVTSSFDPDTNSGYKTCQVGSEETSCIVRGLVNGASYTFQVKTATRMIAHNSPTWTGEAPGLSDFSQPSEPVTPCCDVPAPVQDVVATIARDEIDLAWTAPAQWGGATELEYVVRSMDGNELCRTRATRCRITNVPFETPQTYAVAAINAGGSGEAVKTNPVTIPAQTPTPPPTGKVRYGTRGEANVSWTAPSRDGGSPISAYRVRVTPGAATCRTSGALSCVIEGLTPGRAYTFAVQAENRFGRSDYSVPIVAGRLVTPASRPRELNADVKASSVRLSWKRPKTRGGGALRQYVVKDGPDVVCKTRKTTCEISGLIPGSTHKFSVYAINTSGVGKAAVLTLVTPVPAISAPAPARLPGPRPEEPKPLPSFS
jgi:hypothetical protein